MFNVFKTILLLLLLAILLCLVAYLSLSLNRLMQDIRDQFSAQAKKQVERSIRPFLSEGFHRVFEEALWQSFLTIAKRKSLTLCSHSKTSLGLGFTHLIYDVTHL